jgi:nitrogen regulatory protein P-II 2
MKVTLSKLTIVAERLLKDQLIDLIRKEGATGFTLAAVEGEGSRGVRASDWEGRNVQIETIVAPKTADAILEKLSKDYFDDFAIIAWVVEVGVLRGSKFTSKDTK